MIRSIVALLMGSILTFACTNNNTKAVNNNSKKNIKSTNIKTNEKLVYATFGAGCFWCVEAVFEELQGVASVESGYSGGEKENPTYQDISYGNTNHAEVARIAYDPAIISFAELLEVFWTTHDPTTLNRQGADVGTQYRSVIFYHDEAQKTTALQSKKDVATQLWDDPIVTEVSPLINYYAAEKYHQDYYDLNPNYGYCVAVINPKMEKFRKKFAHKLKGAAPIKTDIVKLPAILKEGNYNPLNDTEQYVILQKGTERSFTGKYHDQKKKGIYICKQCNQPLFSADAKFDSGTGWPSFDDIYATDAVKELTDADGRRVEIVCGNCDGHLGHVFRNEGFTEKNTRHCVNSVSLDFIAQ